MGALAYRPVFSNLFSGNLLALSASLRQGAKPYSTGVSASSRCEQLTIQTRSNGHITAELYNPSTSVRSDRDAPVIIYLPSVSSTLLDEVPQYQLLDIEDESKQALDLATSSNARVLKVNYRLSPSSPYPTPAHDVLAGFDWAVANLFTTPSTFVESPSPSATWVKHGPGKRAWPALPTNKVGVYGDLIGGSLAMMLALTECKLSERGIVAATVTNNSVLDWTNLGKDLLAASLAKDTPSSTTTRRSKASSVNHDALIHDLKVLITLRRHLFLPTSPASYFDPFASPLLFLRTPGVPTPSALPDKQARESTALSSSAEPAVAGHLNPNSDAYQSPEQRATDRNFADLMGLQAERPLAPHAEGGLPTPLENTGTEVDAKPAIYRRVPRNFPPIAYGPTQIPHILVSSSPSPASIALGLSGSAGQGVLEKQAEDFTRVLRRAMVRSAVSQRRPRRSLPGEGARDPDLDYQAADDARVKKAEAEASRAAEAEASRAAEARVVHRPPQLIQGHGPDRLSMAEVGEWMREQLK